jgi:hypothetical protein
MKRTFLLGICMAAMAWLCTACTDKCEQTTTYRYQKAYYVTTAELRSSIASLAPQVLSDPGKIYAKDNYLFINEKKKGIHIIDNSNPSLPTFVSFINIPGNTDIAVKGNILYADSYVDFLAIDITDPKNIKVVSRTEDAFPSGSIDGTHWQYNFTQKTIIDYRWETVTQTYTTDCDGAGYPIAYANDMSYYSKAGAATAGGSTSTTGTGGSMARFAIANDYLYAVTNSDMQLFNIQKPEKPSKGNLVNLGWGIETIFPYNNLLFVGTTTGMQILDNTNPVKPEHLSTVSHVMSCDPVVVDGKYAYVTLHTGDSWCRNGVNQLDVINIENPRSPTVIKSYSWFGYRQSDTFCV